MDLSKAPVQIKTIPQEKINELDVRPILKNGGEPFSVIMDTLERTQADGAFRLRATFEPVPLFRVLGKKGWSHWVEFGEGEDWIIWFYHETHAEEDCPKKQTATFSALIREFPELSNRLKTEEGLWTLDVRKLSPPEPMELTLAALEKLPAHTTLLQINERVPQFLLPLLEERGFEYSLQHEKEEVIMRITGKTG